MQQTDLLVGDRVVFKPSDAPGSAVSLEGVIADRLPRQNCLDRPRVANIDLLVLVMALKSPDPDWQMANRLLVLSERQGLRSLLCLNKSDLLGAEELERISPLLEHFPYPYILTSALYNRGISALRDQLKGSLVVFAGPSGSGKSSLLNALEPGFSLKTGSVSAKIRRGRHITRTAEIFFLNGGGAVVDTPGFSRIEFYDLPAEHLGCYFPEMDLYSSGCSFRDCCHISEPGCAVREAVALNKISDLRYENYKVLYHELADRSSDQR